MARELVPNSTQIPDVILDFWLSELSGAQMKVVLYIARRTYGFGKASDNISLNQICKGIRKRDGTVLDTGTGLSRPGAIKAIKSLEERHIIFRKHNLKEATGEYEENTYSLNIYWPDARPEGGDQGSEEVGNSVDHLVNKAGQRRLTELTTGSKLSLPGVGNRVNPQETEIQETDQETAARASAALIEELVAHNLNRRDAVRFVRENPEECRRQLDYLRYLPPRQDEGRWLAAAIAGQFSAPSTFRQEQERDRRKTKARSAKASQNAQDARRARLWPQYIEYLQETENRLKASHFDAYRQFEASEAQERAKYRRLGLSECVFDREAEHHQRLQQFFDDFSACPVLDFEAWSVRLAADFQTQPHLIKQPALTQPIP